MAYEAVLTQPQLRASAIKLNIGTATWFKRVSSQPTGVMVTEQSQSVVSTVPLLQENGASQSDGRQLHRKTSGFYNESSSASNIHFTPRGQEEKESPGLRSQQVTGHCYEGLPNATFLDLEGNTPGSLLRGDFVQLFIQRSKWHHHVTMKSTELYGVPPKLRSNTYSVTIHKFPLPR